MQPVPFCNIAISPVPAHLMPYIQDACSEARPPCGTSLDTISEIKEILKDFLRRLNYRSPHTPPNAKLRAEVTAEIASWNADLSPSFMRGLAETSYVIAESAYAHTSYTHQRVIAIYTAYLTYVDDLGGRDLDVLSEFGRRLLAREPFGDPALDRLVVMLQDMYAYYPRLSAHSIAVSTLDFFVGSYVEVTGKKMAVAPGATKYPGFMRLKTGIGAAYALFNFVKDWRDPADHFFLQLIPYVGCPLVLSLQSADIPSQRDRVLHRYDQVRSCPFLSYETS